MVKSNENICLDARGRSDIGFACQDQLGWLTYSLCHERIRFLSVSSDEGRHFSRLAMKARFCSSRSDSVRRGGRVVDCTGLLSRRTVRGTEGSNPSLSASHILSIVLVLRVVLGSASCFLCQRLWGACAAVLRGL